MLIEHTSRSTEDKPEIYICVGVLRQLAGCFNQQSLSRLASTSCVTPTALKDSASHVNANQLKNSPEKSMHAAAENSTQQTRVSVKQPRIPRF